MKKLLWLIVPVLIAQCTPSDKGKIPHEEEEQYRARGGEIVELAFKELSGNLKKAIGDSGVTGAINYCNVHALPILDSVSRQQGVIIRRTSGKIRNPANKPDDFEKKILTMYEHASEKGQELTPKIGIDARKRVNYYHPIQVKGLCLNCHGNKNNGLVLSTYEKILEKYPDDKAFNYSEGDFRGMWVVTFPDSTSSGQ